MKAYLLMLFGCTYILFGSISDGQLSENAGTSTLYQLIWILLYVVLICLLVVRHSTAITRLIYKPLPLMLLLSGVVSYLLSPPDDNAVAVKFAMYCTTILFGLWLSVRVSPATLLREFYKLTPIVLTLHWMAFPVVSGTINYDAGARLTALGLPAYGGIFGHKNLAGVFFGLALLANWSYCLSTKQDRKFALYLCGFIFFTLIMTGAAGPLLSTVEAAALVTGFHLIARGSPFAVPYWTLLILMTVAGVVFGLSGGLELVGRDATFSGRFFLVENWPRFYFERPLFGYGYAGFFTNSSNSPSLLLSALSEWNTRYYTFESSYLELLIEFGAVGGILILFIMLGAYKRVFVYLKRNAGSVDGLMPLSLLLGITLYSTSDTYLILHNHIFTALLFWCYFGFGNSAGQSRLSQTAATTRKRISRPTPVTSLELKSKA